MCLRAKSTARSAEALLRKEKSMVTIKVKDGTPQGAETLCVTCRWAHIVKGFRESEKEIFCRYLTDDRPVRFPVSQCNSYDDRRIPSKRDMEQIAWILLTKRRAAPSASSRPSSSGRSKGMMRKSSPQLQLNRRCKSRQRAHPPIGGCGFCVLKFQIPTGGCHAKRTLQRSTLLSSAAVSAARAIHPKPK
jgi:hypothetical protein